MLIFFIAISSLLLCFFVNSPVRAANIDRYILYNIDECFRYYYAQLSISNPVTFLNPYAKPITMLLSNIFIRIFPFGILSLRIMNAFFSISIILILRRIMKKMGIGDIAIIIAIVMTISFPTYFLAACSTLSEIVFCFFLIAALFMYIQEQYTSYYILLSLLPLIRQEGLLFLIAGIILSPRPVKIQRLFCFFPVVIWILLNSLILKHPLDHIYLYLYRVSGGNPPPDVLLPLSKTKDFIFNIFIAPLLSLIFFLAGLKYVNRKYRIILYFIMINIGVIIALNSYLIFAFKKIAYELRFIVPTIPLIAIYAGAFFQRLHYLLKARFRVPGYLIIGLIIFMIAGFNIYYLKQIQNFPYIKSEFISPAQEKVFEKAESWLSEYLERERIGMVYSDSNKMTNKFVRRLIISLTPDTAYYGFNYKKMNLVDVVTFKEIGLFKKKAVMFIVREENYQPLVMADWELIKSFPELNLDFYLVAG